MKKLLKKLKRFYKKKSVVIVTVVIVLLLIISLLCLTLLKEEEPSTIKYEDYTISEGHYGKIEKYDSSYTVDGYKGGNKAYYITGNITAKKDKSFTKIVFDLYDKEGKKIGTAVDGVKSLKKGKVYKFKALGIIDSKNIENIDSYKINTIELGN